MPLCDRPARPAAPAPARLALPLLFAVVLSGCGSETPTPPGPTPTEPGATPTASGTPTASPTPTAQACTTDLDGDTHVDRACAGGDDCNDNNASVYPGAAEGIDSNGDLILEGDNLDNNCDGVVDEGTDRYDDDDDGYSEIEGDCNDRAPGIGIEALEACDGVDNNCDGLTDNKDTDQDTFIDKACGGDDCADTRADIHPGAAEGPDTNSDGVAEADFDDNDCDGTIDESTDAYDDDGDGKNDLEGDCDDDDALVYPGAIERFDDKDQNCDGSYVAGNTAASAPASVVGFLANARAGFSVAGTGDVDGDGVGDVLVGAPGHDAAGTSKGAAFLLVGRDRGWGDEEPLAESASFTFSGSDGQGAQAGFAVAGTGDINGDGYNDFAIGAPDYTANNNARAGAVYLFPGKGVPWDDSILGQQTSYGGSNSYGLAANVQFGYSLAGNPEGGCDITGDGIGDVIVGGPWDQASPGIQARGYLMMYPGVFGTLDPDIRATDLTSYQGAPSEAIGYNVGCAGDTNGIAELGGGYPSDVLVAGKGDTTNAGKIYWLAGSENFATTGPKLQLPAGTVSWTGDASEAWVGQSLSGLGDLDGDSLADFGVGRRTRGTGGSLGYIVYSGQAAVGGSVEGAATLRITGTDTETCPCVVRGIGDFNQDGYRDLVVSAATASGAGGESQAGRIFIFLGKAEGFGVAGGSLSTSQADHVFTGEAAGDQFGASVTALPDVNGDAYPDFAVGAPRTDVDLGGGALADAGKVYLFFGFDL